jgi:hypothetical protein
MPDEVRGEEFFDGFDLPLIHNLFDEAAKDGFIFGERHAKASFEELLNALEHHVPILLGVAGLFLGGVVVLGNGQLRPFPDWR